MRPGTPAAVANLTTRATLHRHTEMQKAFGEPVDAPLSETNERILQRLATKVLKEMLYVEEVPLPGGIEGTGIFQTAFEEGRKTAPALLEREPERTRSSVQHCSTGTL